MARREYYYSPGCVHEGCTERAHYVSTTRRDQQEVIQDVKRRGGWRCVRHTNPDEVLSVASPVREKVLVSYETSYGRFFAEESVEKGGSGFQHGPGFKVYAKDFPPGTRLIVTARIETPRMCPNADCGRPLDECPCGFCHGLPVGNARSWVDGKAHVPAACPRCGEVNQP